MRVRLECRRTAELPEEFTALERPDRAALVHSLAVFFDPGAAGQDAVLFAAMAGELTADNCPTDIFLLTRKRPASWPK